MDVAALAISIMALVAATASAVFTWRQARAQAQATAIEKDRWLAERKPVFEHRVVDYDGYSRIEVINTGPIDLDEVVFSLGGSNVPCELRATGTPKSVKAVPAGPLGVGDVASVEIVVPDQQPIAVFKFLVACRFGDDRWQVVLQCQVETVVNPLDQIW